LPEFNLNQVMAPASAVYLLISCIQYTKFPEEYKMESRGGPGGQEECWLALQDNFSDESFRSIDISATTQIPINAKR